MIIAQISDTHIDLDDPDKAARLDDFERAVAAINRLDPLPDLVIHSGDITHFGTVAEYETARRILSTLRCPFHVAVGNRDKRATLHASFPAASAFLPGTRFVQYCIDTFPARLIVLDTLCEGSNQGEFCEIRADNLRNALSRDTARPALIFMHHPPFVVHASKYPVQFEDWGSVDRLAGALAGQDHVAAIFCGHSHRAAEGEVGGVPASSMPSVAVDLRLGDFPAEFASAPLFRLHSLDRAGNVKSKTLPA